MRVWICIRLGSGTPTPLACMGGCSWKIYTNTTAGMAFLDTYPLRVYYPLHINALQTISHPCRTLCMLPALGLITLIAPSRGLNGFGGALTTGYIIRRSYLNALNINDIFWHVASMLLSLGIHALQHLLE